MIPEETIKAVLDSTDIVDVIGSYFPIKRAGSAFVCNCPFHNEKTPSFNINPARQFFIVSAVGKVVTPSHLSVNTRIYHSAMQSKSSQIKLVSPS